MKKVFLILTLLSSTASFANSSVSNEKLNYKIKVGDSKVSKITVTNTAKKVSLGDCTLTIKGNFGGHKVDVVVTISDVSWVKCTAMKAGIVAASQ